MAFYYFERTHQGYRVAGRTPARALIAQQRALPPISEPAEEGGAGQLTAYQPSGLGVGETLDLYIITAATPGEDSAVPGT